MNNNAYLLWISAVELFHRDSGFFGIIMFTQNSLFVLFLYLMLVEKKRRSKINDYIHELATLLPENYDM